MDFSRVLRLVGDFFEEVDHPYAVIGALGLAARGVSRATFDVDIVANGDVQDQLIAFLESNGYRTEHRSSGYSNHVNTEEDLGRLDFVYVRGETAQRLFEGISNLDGPGGLKIPVPRPEHLAALKIFAIKNNPRRVLRDLDDIRRILQIPGVDREEVVAYIRKQGLEDLLERLD